MTQSLLLGEQPRLYPDFYRCQQCAENLRDDQRARRGVEPDGLAQEDGPAPVVEKFPQLNVIKAVSKVRYVRPDWRFTLCSLQRWSAQGAYPCCSFF